MKEKILFLLAFFPFIVNGQIISFQDNNVKKICVHNWDTNGDGELSQAEAAAVTSIGTIFNNNSSIMYFEELEYFTGLNILVNDAFRSCSNLIKIKLPNNIANIGESAFYNCSSLISISISSSVTSIGNYAFYGCSKLTTITIPNSVTSIGNYAFYGCSKLTTITIPNSVTSIGNYAFYGCKSLYSIIIPYSVTSIGDYAFYYGAPVKSCVYP